MIGRQASAHEFEAMIVDEFAELSAAATQVPLVMSIVLHSFITGVPFRLRAVRRALEQHRRRRRRLVHHAARDPPRRRRVRRLFPPPVAEVTS